MLAKKDVTKNYWPRLIKNSAKNQYIQIDWDKWVDEDSGLPGEDGYKDGGDYDG